MTADEFVLWAERQERGRYELVDGMIVEMNAEQLGHVRAKWRLASLLQTSLASSGLDGEVLGDGMALRIAERVVHEPDVMVRMGSPLPGSTLHISDPVIVVEVLSPSTGPVDTGTKLVNYFKVETVEHYLVVSTTDQVVLHYRRGADREPVMTMVRSGEIALSPPGLKLAMAEIFA